VTAPTSLPSAGTPEPTLDEDYLHDRITDIICQYNLEDGELTTEQACRAIAGACKTAVRRAALSSAPQERGDVSEDVRDAALWRWFRDRACVGTTEDNEVYLSALVGEPADVECFTDAERELFENDSPDPSDWSSLCQRIAEWHSDVAALRSSPPAPSREEVEAAVDEMLMHHERMLTERGMGFRTVFRHSYDSLLALLERTPTETPK